MKFVCVGIDARRFPSKDRFSADSAEWERDEAWYSRLIAEGEIFPNEYGLLSVKRQDVLEKIIRQVLDASESCDLVAVELPCEVVQFFDEKWGLQTSLNELDLSKFVCCGFDVCDVNGLVTLLNHPLLGIYRDENGLIAESKLSRALEAVQLANVVEANHRPAILAKVYSLREALKDPMRFDQDPSV